MNDDPACDDWNVIQTRLGRMRVRRLGQSEVEIELDRVGSGIMSQGQAQALAALIADATSGPMP